MSIIRTIELIESWNIVSFVFIKNSIHMFIQNTLIGFQIMFMDVMDTGSKKEEKNQDRELNIRQIGCGWQDVRNVLHGTSAHWAYPLIK